MKLRDRLRRDRGMKAASEPLPAEEPVEDFGGRQ
jgi:hypothetical protein